MLFFATILFGVYFVLCIMDGRDRWKERRLVKRECAMIDYELRMF